VRLERAGVDVVFGTLVAVVGRTRSRLVSRWASPCEWYKSEEQRIAQTKITGMPHGLRIIDRHTATANSAGRMFGMVDKP
jgi:hypothetical protein